MKPKARYFDNIEKWGVWDNEISYTHPSFYEALHGYKLTRARINSINNLIMESSKLRPRYKRASLN